MSKNTIAKTEEQKKLAKEQKIVDRAREYKPDSRLLNAIESNAISKKPMTDVIYSLSGLFSTFVPNNITDHQAFKADLQNGVFALSCYEAMVKFSAISDCESAVTATSLYKAMSDDERAEVLAPLESARQALNDALSMIRKQCPDYAGTKKSWSSYTKILNDIPKFTRMLAWLILPTLGPSTGKGSNKTYAVEFAGQNEMLQTLRLFGRQARESCNVTGEGTPATLCKNAIVKFFDGVSDASYTKQFDIRVSNVALFDCMNAIFTGRKLNARTGKFRMVETDDYGVIYQVMAAVFGTCFKLDTEDVEEANAIEDIKVVL